MNRLYASVIVGLLFSAVVLAQQPSSDPSSSHLVLVNTAEVLPNLTLTINGATSVLSSHSSLFHGNIALGLGDVAELALGKSDGIINALGAPRADVAWALKLKLFSKAQDQPQIALRIQSSVGWISDELWPQDIQTYSPALYRRGLYDSHYDLRLTSIQVLLSHQLFRNVGLHTGVGIEEIATRGLWIIVDPAPFVGNGLHAPDIAQELLLSGFLSLTVRLDSKFTLLTEIQSLPAVSPNIDLVKLNVDRAYVGSLAVRYSLLAPLALDGGIVVRTNPYTRNDVEMRLGLNTLLDLQ